MIKVFITKYALTDGLIERWADYTDENKSRIKVANSIYINSFYGKDEFHLTIEDAIKDAEKRRLKKIQSLEKQIEILKNLKF